MSGPSPRLQVPRELSALQQDFTTVLRTPLDTRTKTFLPDLRRCPEALSTSLVDGTRGTGVERLGVYQRQYWLRLFTVMQGELPLSARLIGLYRFNQLVQLYLGDCAPRDHDVGDIADRFPAWLDAHNAALPRFEIRVPKAALQQAVAVDDAWRQVWTAQRVPSFAPNADDAARLSRSRLIAAPTCRLVDTDWPFVEERRALMTDASAEHITLPSRLGRARHWLILRTEGGIGQLRLSPRQSQLYRLCTQLPLEQAVTRLSEQCSRQERKDLATQVQAWFAQSMALGLWAGAES